MIGNNFAKEHVIGTNNLGHLIVIIFYFTFAIILAYKLAKKDEKLINKVFIICAIYVFVAEVIKMTYRLITNGTFKYVFPMPFCFLFIPAILLYFIKNENIKHMATVFLSSGSLMGGSLYIFIPNGSIDKYPLYHINAIHGLSFHFIMVVIGLILLMKKMYVPKLSDYKYYFIFMSTASIIALICNSYSGGNALFFGNASGISILEKIIEKSHLLHIILVFVGESILLFFVFYVIYLLIMYAISKYKLKHTNLCKQKS